MTMFRDVYNHCLLPAEQEVAHPSSCCHGDTEVAIVGHEHQHEEVADDHLDDVQYCLKHVSKAQHPLPGEINKPQNKITKIGQNLSSYP